MSRVTRIRLLASLAVVGLSAAPAAAWPNISPLKIESPKVSVPNHRGSLPKPPVTPPKISVAKPKLSLPKATQVTMPKRPVALPNPGRPSPVRLPNRVTSGLSDAGGRVTGGLKETAIRPRGGLKSVGGG